MIKRSGLFAAAMICTLAAAGGYALAGDKPAARGGLDGMQTVKPTELKALQGGTETDGTKIIDSFNTLHNESHVSGTNTDNNITNSGIFSTGGTTATVTGNSGMTSVTQVTGAMNNVANNVMYNIYLK